ncbi:hypothetical protein [Oleisolibacter albus]|uniref:hypothetical protein n=1 Tax=Oleisolibacter albus TaxID=2171757 RepID=UPI000DF39821|nr:hypothetical protein [Oleisolibacter albus]
MGFRDAWREALAAYLLVLAEPRRAVRFAGAPALIFALLGLVQLTAGPEGGSLFLLLNMVAMVFGWGLWTLRWQRFLLLGDDGPRFWDLPLDRRIWRVGGTLTALFFGSVVMVALVLSLLLTLILGLLGVADGGVPLSAQVPVLLGVMLSAGLILARMGPGITALSLDRRFDPLLSWRVCGWRGGFAPLLAVLLTAVPLELLPTGLAVAYMIQGDPLYAVLMQLIRVVTYPLSTGLTALVWARIYAVAIAPAETARPA